MKHIIRFLVDVVLGATFSMFFIAGRSGMGSVGFFIMAFIAGAVNIILQLYANEHD